MVTQIIYLIIFTGHPRIEMKLIKLLFFTTQTSCLIIVTITSWRCSTLQVSLNSLLHLNFQSTFGDTVSERVVSLHSLNLCQKRPHPEGGLRSRCKDHIGISRIKAKYMRFVSKLLSSFKPSKKQLKLFSFEKN